MAVTRDTLLEAWTLASQDARIAATELHVAFKVRDVDLAHVAELMTEHIVMPEF
jgi:hypothetical protein